MLEKAVEVEHLIADSAQTVVGVLRRFTGTVERIVTFRPALRFSMGLLVNSLPRSKRIAGARPRVLELTDQLVRLDENHAPCGRARTSGSATGLALALTSALQGRRRYRASGS